MLCVEVEFFLTVEHEGLFIEGLEFGLVLRFEPEERVLFLVLRVGFGCGLVFLLSIELNIIITT